MLRTANNLYIGSNGINTISDSREQTFYKVYPKHNDFIESKVYKIYGIGIKLSFKVLRK